jgi:small redox-active disulfide protein 2
MNKTRIEILGPGCANCKTLYERAESAARDLGLDYEIEKIADMDVILGYRVMSTPALVVNGRVKVSGRVPSVAQLKEMLS